MNTTEQKIKLIKQAIELKTGRKCKVWNDEAFCYFSYEGEGQYQQSRRISNHLLNLLPLSETEVNGVTEKNGWAWPIHKQLDLNDIDMSSKEGKLLMAALVKLTTESQQDKTPWEVLAQCKELAEKMYQEPPDDLDFSAMRINTRRPTDQ